MKQLNKYLKIIGLLAALFVVAIFFWMKSSPSFFGHHRSEKPEVLAIESTPETEAPAESEALKLDVPVREGAAPEPEARVDKSGLINIAEEVAQTEQQIAQREKQQSLESVPAAVIPKVSEVNIAGSVAPASEGLGATSTFAQQRDFDPEDIKVRVEARIQKSLAAGTLKPKQVHAYREYLTRLANEEALGEQHIVEQPTESELFADGAFLTDEN